MAEIILERPIHTGARPHLVDLRRHVPGFQAYMALYLGFIALPIVAGADKFTHYLADWTVYLAPVVANNIGVPAEMFMRGVGLIEIAAGLLVALWPRWGSVVVGAWLLCIIGNLLLVPGFYDVALRDFGLFLGAYALRRLSLQYE
ncbi:MAG TPA: hypothetical protein VNI01_05870 [Elusimicrobiota bacterium]|jgi:hypothetical protein|nr:hypothetical protein [Elusimicrobiota bacterium]